MGRSKAKSSPAKAKASPIAVDTEAEHAAHVRDGIDVVQRAIEFLRVRRQYVTDASKAVANPGAPFFPRGWNGSKVDKVSYHTGLMSDVAMTVSPGNGMTYPSVPQLLDSAAYWWSKDRVMATDVLMITTYASETTERGQLQIAEDCTKFMSFLLSWAMSWGFKPSGDDEDDTPPKDQELCDKYKGLSLSVSFIVTRIHEGDNMMLRVLQMGEDVSQKVMEAGNVLPLLFAQRLVQLRSLLLSEHKRATHEDILKLLQSNIHSSTEETKLKSPDQIQKLLSLYEKASKANMLAQLQGVQVIDGARTWVSRWAIVTRVSGMLRSSEEFRFVMEFICETMRPTGSRFRVITDLNMRQLTRDQAVEVTQMLQLKYRLLQRLVSLELPDEIKSYISGAMNPREFSDSDHNVVGLAEEHHMLTAQLAREFLVGTHDRQLMAAITTGQKEDHPEVAKLLQTVIDKHKMALNKRTPNTAVEESAPCDEEQQEDDAEPTPTPVDPAAKKKAAAQEAAKEEIEYYVHFLQGNLDDSAGKQALMDGLQHHTILQGDASKAWFFDSALIVEPAGHFNRWINPFTKSPVFHKGAYQTFANLFDSLASPADVFCTFDSGLPKALSEIRKGTSVALQSMSFIPNQESLQFRKDFGKKRQSDESAQKRRKTMAAGDLQAVSGKETFLFGRKAEKGPLECREHKYLRVAGCFETTAVSAIVIPLPLPGSLPKIRKSQKMQLMPSVAKRQLLTEKDEHFESDMAETDLVAMSLFERCEVTYKMMLHTIWDPARVILMTPGAGRLPLLCVRLRVPVLVVVRSPLHKKLLMEVTLTELARHVLDANDDRFYRRHLDGSGSPSAEQQAPGAETQAPGAETQAPNQNQAAPAVPQPQEDPPEPSEGGDSDDKSDKSDSGDDL